MHWLWTVRHRLLVSVLLAIAVAFLLPSHYLWLTRALCIWDAGLVSFLSLTLLLMLQATPEMMRHHAQQLDAGRLVILSSIVAAACASVLALVFLLHDTKGLDSNLLVLHLGLSVLTIIGSWLLVHTVFTMHYARGYYQNPRKKTGRLKPRLYKQNPPPRVEENTVVEMMLSYSVRGGGHRLCRRGFNRRLISVSNIDKRHRPR